jgi:Ca2+ transporting ATPase
LPGKLKLGAGSKDGEIEVNERQAEPEEEIIDDLTPRGQILWIRGLTRLQHQVRAF